MYRFEFVLRSEEDAVHAVELETGDDESGDEEEDEEDVLWFIDACLMSEEEDGDLADGFVEGENEEEEEEDGEYVHHDLREGVRGQRDDAMFDESTGERPVKKRRMMVPARGSKKKWKRMLLDIPPEVILWHIFPYFELEVVAKYRVFRRLGGRFRQRIDTKAYLSITVGGTATKFWRRDVFDFEPWEFHGYFRRDPTRRVYHLYPHVSVWTKYARFAYFNEKRACQKNLLEPVCLKQLRTLTCNFNILTREMHRCGILSSLPRVQMLRFIAPNHMGIVAERMYDLVHMFLPSLPHIRIFGDDRIVLDKTTRAFLDERNPSRDDRGFHGEWVILSVN